LGKAGWKVTVKKRSANDPNEREQLLLFVFIRVYSRILRFKVERLNGPLFHSFADKGSVAKRGF
jgi:hypothetical protein